MTSPASVKQSLLIPALATVRCGTKTHIIRYQTTRQERRDEWTPSPYPRPLSGTEFLTDVTSASLLSCSTITNESKMAFAISDLEASGRMSMLRLGRAEGRMEMPREWCVSAMRSFVRVPVSYIACVSKRSGYCVGVMHPHREGTFVLLVPLPHVLLSVRSHEGLRPASASTISVNRYRYS